MTIKSWYSTKPWTLEPCCLQKATSTTLQPSRTNQGSSQVSNATVCQLELFRGETLKIKQCFNKAMDAIRTCLPLRTGRSSFVSYSGPYRPRRLSAGAALGQNSENKSMLFSKAMKHDPNVLTPANPAEQFRVLLRTISIWALCSDYQNGKFQHKTG